MGLRPILFGIVLGVLLMGCAGFGYRYYGLEGVRYSDGKLLGEEEKDDLPFEYCQPTAGNARPCVVMFTDEFFRLKQDLLDTRSKLKDCQKGLALSSEQ